MIVTSGQMPYNYGFGTPVRSVVNIGISGSMLEAGMFLYAAELRKWDVTQDSVVQHDCFIHPNIAETSFEPQADGSTLDGCLIVPNNIEKMRDNLEFNLLDAYRDDSDYTRSNFLEAWLRTAYPDGSDGDDFFRPAATSVTGGDDILSTDVGLLAGSGIFLDIDVGEVLFNPFPFPAKGGLFAIAQDNVRFEFGPITPVVQNTLGDIPTVNAARYRRHADQNGQFKANINVEAIESGVVQIDGYAIIDGTTIELVEGNDTNFIGTLAGTNDYTTHVQGLRQVADGDGFNDNSARIYRTPTAQASGLYRFITYSKKSDVPDTTIPSGFVSIWPQGDVREFPLKSFINGKQYAAANDGGTIFTPAQAKGVHVTNDAIWLATRNDFEGSGTFHSAGLTAISPYNGQGIWYRPAERVLSSVGADGPKGLTMGEQAYFGAHHGLFLIGSNVIRLAKAVDTSVTGSSAPFTTTATVYWQKFNRTTLDHTEQSDSFVFTGAGSVQVENTHGVFSDGTDIYSFNDFSQIVKWTTGLVFDGVYDALGAHGGIAGRRHTAGGDLLYTITDNIGAADPFLTQSPSVSQGSGIGKFTITTVPANINADIGTFDHTLGAAKPIRGEDHFGFAFDTSTNIHSIFDVTGSSHIPNGIWMIIQLDTDVYLARIKEGASEWAVLDSILLDLTGGSFTGLTSTDMPWEAIQLDID